MICKNQEPDIYQEVEMRDEERVNEDIKKVHCQCTIKQSSDLKSMGF
jgi:hypothetical protein